VIKSVSLVIISFLYLQSLQGQPIDLQSLNQNLKQLSALSGYFTQENVDLLQDRNSKASGRFFFLRPGLMKWIYEKPDPYSIIAGKERIWIYDPVLENVTIHKAEDVSGVKIISLLLEPEKIQRSFRIIKPKKMLLDVAPGDKLLFLAHKTEDPNIAEIQLAFSATYQIKQFVIVEMNRNYRKITLQKLNTQPQLSQSDFEFKIPDGVEIIDKTRVEP